MSLCHLDSGELKHADNIHGTQVPRSASTWRIVTFLTFLWRCVMLPGRLRCSFRFLSEDYYPQWCIQMFPSLNHHLQPICHESTLFRAQYWWSHLSQSVDVGPKVWEAVRKTDTDIIVITWISTTQWICGVYVKKKKKRVKQSSLRIYRSTDLSK